MRVPQLLLICLGAATCVKLPAQAQPPPDPCPAYVPYSCKTFAEKSAIARTFLAEYRQNRAFVTTTDSSQSLSSNPESVSINALRHAYTAALSTLSDAGHDPQLFSPMLALWIELFRSIDDGRQAEQQWYSERAMKTSGCINFNGPFDWNDPKIASMVQSAHVNCIHSNDAIGLQHLDGDASDSFNFLVFASGSSQVNRNDYSQQIAASNLPPGRKALLLACFDHAGNRKWEPPDLYPGVPPPLNSPPPQSPASVGASSTPVASVN